MQHAMPQHATTSVGLVGSSSVGDINVYQDARCGTAVHRPVRVDTSTTAVAS